MARLRGEARKTAISATSSASMMRRNEFRACGLIGELFDIDEDSATAAG